MSESIIEHILSPKEKDLGDGFVVRRTLPSIQKRMVGPFVFWDHLGPVELHGDKNMLVRAHPHIGLATITWLFSGEILHRDSLGNEQSIRPGEVNWMTAGRGIVHSERALDCTLEAIQLWVALPEDKEDIDPKFEHRKESELPLIENDNFKLRLIVGRALGVESPIEVHSDIFYLSGNIKKSSSFEFDLLQNQEGAIYLTRGELVVEGNKVTPGTMIIFKQGSQISFESTEESEFMLLGGDKFEKTPSLWWNFVSHNKEKMEKAKTDWKNGNFPKVINETEFIPLPKE